MSLVSIIIANLNGAGVLPQCLESLAAQTFTGFEIIIVDNGSTDGSAERLEGVRVIRLPHNYGFAHANNLGARQAQGVWLAFLNNDAFPAPTWLEALLSTVNAYPNCACFASQIRQASDPRLLDSAGDTHHFSGFVAKRGHDQPVVALPDTPTEVFSASGAAALVRRDAFWAVDGFDKDFFAYHEDIDLGFRLRLAGHHCLYVPAAVVYHVGSATGGKRSDFTVRYGQRNMVWSFVKNMPGVLFWRYLPAHVLLNLVFVVYLGLRGQGRAALSAKWEALRGLPGVWRKRQRIQAARLASPADIPRALS